MSKIHKRRNHTAAFKKEVVLANFKGEKSIQQIAAEYEVMQAFFLENLCHQKNSF